MRTKALILFFPFVVFLAETSGFVQTMQNGCASLNTKKSTCVKVKQKDKCCHKTPGKVPADNTCNDKGDCSTCPVCYTFIFQQQYEWVAHQFFFKKNYGMMTTGYISSYTSNVWKPPNGFLFIS